MVQYYTIFGRKVGSHVLSIATLSAVFGGSALAMGGKKVEQAEKGPAVNAGSKEEENFIKEYVSKQDADKAKH